MITYIVTTRLAEFYVSFPIEVTKRAVGMVLSQLGIKYETVNVFC